MGRNIILTGLLSGFFLSASLWHNSSYAGDMSYREPAENSPDKPSLLQKIISFSAKKISYDHKKNLITATGDVTLHQGKNVLIADKIIFDRTKHEVKATGNITLRDNKGNIMFLDDAVLKDDLKNGFIRNVRVLFSDNGHLVAKSGMRAGSKTIFKQAAYTPCTSCNRDGKRKPLWQIRADTITHDKNNKTIKYRNVVLEIAGIPIFYSPYFSHPDPTVHSASGLLTPDFSSSSQLGVNVTIPYYFNLAPDKDLTLEPLFTQKEGIVMAGTYRQNTGNGQFFIKGSLTNASIRDNNLIKTGAKQIRGHIFSGGKFNLDSLKLKGGQWQWDYALRLVSNDTYLRRYYQNRTDTLKSHIKIEDFSGRSYFTTGLYGFQGLDKEDFVAITGQALPTFNLDIVSTPGKWGNQFTLNANGVAIVRTGGLNSRRLSLKGAWKLPLRTSLGDIYTFTASIRGDVFNNGSAKKRLHPFYGGRNGTFSRILPKFAVDWRLPFIRNGETTQQIIEPLVSIIIAPNHKNSPNIANEDSRNIEFNENNLFSHNRYNGYDRWEGGTRINYGIRYSLYAKNTTIVAVFGQSRRLKSSGSFPAGSGYEGKTSDFVGRIDMTIGKYIDYVHRFRLDKNSLRIRRNEMIFSGGTKKIRASVRFLNLDRRSVNLTNSELKNRKEMGLALKYIIKDGWTLHGNWVRDLLRKTTISYNAGILYHNECLEFGLSFQRRLTTDRDITPSSTFHLRLVLKHLG